MNSKSLLIAIAAFALTATGVQAYGGAKMLGRAGLSEDQIEAIEEAQELRAAGKRTEARDRLVDAGITDDNLRIMHQVAHETRMAVREAVEDRNYVAFKKAIEGMPLADIITSETDFEQFCDAHELRQAGEWDEADELMKELGVQQGAFGHSVMPGSKQPFLQFTEEQREALRAARQANDRATIQAIFDEAGVEHHPRGKNR